MKFTEEEIKDHKFSLDNFILRRKPPLQFQQLLQHSYKIKNNKIIIETIRYDNEIRNALEIAKIVLSERPNSWSVYWKRYNEKWELYNTETKLNTLSSCLRVIDEDKDGCFFG